MPDGIASYTVGGKTFLITANEGDAREYEDEDADFEFIEAERIGNDKIMLDPVAFPDAEVLKENANLGRLDITTTLGKNPTTGLYEALFAFGGRSFSIWSAAGDLVFDSGDDLEWITASTYPEHFNASNDNNNFDNRSDNKGPEPEGVVIGHLYGKDYAFVGLERIGGVAVYNVSNPYAPHFVTYVNVRDFDADVDSSAAGDLGPEGLVFIEARNSPNHKPLLVIGNEVSGITRILQINQLQ